MFLDVLFVILNVEIVRFLEFSIIELNIEVFGMDLGLNCM